MVGRQDLLPKGGRRNINASIPLAQRYDAHVNRADVPPQGTVATIARGRGSGYVRESRGELLYFNRRDVVDGTFNDLDIGDAVAFEVIEDAMSGHRAARVAKR